MLNNLIPTHELDRFALEVENSLVKDDPFLLSSLHDKPYKTEAIRYILLVQYRHLLNKYSDDCIFFTQFFWHTIARGVIQAVDMNSLLFIGDMDDVLGSPSGFFDENELSSMYEKTEEYINSWLENQK